MNTPPLIVYFDGLCPLCSREIEHYRRQVADDSVRFVDITAPEFDARAEGLDPLRIHRVLHVKEAGEIRTGVDAFLAIWSAIPRYRRWARIARSPWVRPILNVGYRAFAAVRPWLPRRKRPNCDTGACRSR